MVAEALITFRETLEAALVIGIILAFLQRTGNSRLYRHVYLGAGAGVVASAFSALAFGDISNVLRGISPELFEGGLLLFAAAMLTWMILWMAKQKHVKGEIEKEVGQKLSGRATGLAAFAFVAVFREGIETVVFLNAAFLAGGASASVAGALFGIAAAIVLAYAIFETALKVDLKLFFNATSVLLVLFAAGMVSYAVHEFQEAKVLEDQAPLWDTKGILDEKGETGSLGPANFLGSVAKVMLGYDDRPTPFQALGYLGYLALVAIAWKNIDRLHKVI